MTDPHWRNTGHPDRLARFFILGRKTGNAVYTYPESFHPSIFSEDQKETTLKALKYWFNFDTWTLNQAANLIVGTDPYQSTSISLEKYGEFGSDTNPVWVTLWEETGISSELDAHGFPHPTGYYFIPDQMFLRLEFLKQWKARHKLRKCDWGDMHPPKMYLSLAIDKSLTPYWLEWAIDRGLYIHAATKSSTPDKDLAEKRVTAAQAQSTSILQAIRELGHDPMRLPVSPQGTPGLKKAIRDKLVGRSSEFPGNRRFDAAWQRLLDQSDIAYGKPSQP